MSPKSLPRQRRPSPPSGPEPSPRRTPAKKAARREGRSPKRTDPLSSILASGALARLVIHFAVRPDEAPHMRALQRHTGLTPRSLQLELARLERLGLVERRAAGRRVEYVPNEASPRWRVLRQLIRELADPVDVVGDALTDVPNLEAAFVFGSFARGDAREPSDVDLFVLEKGDAEDDDHLLIRRTLDAGVLLGREVNVVQMTRADLRRRLAAETGFVRRVLAGPKRWVLGDARALDTGNLASTQLSA